MKLQLKRPLVFIDLETTCLDREEARIVDFAAYKLFPDGNVETYSRWINPGVPIPEQSSEIHGITDEKVAQCPTFMQVAGTIQVFIAHCDLGGFNCINFDFPVLFNEFGRAGIYWDYTSSRMIDVGNIFKIKQPRTLSAAVQFYLGKDLENAHGAQADIEATAQVLLAQLERYEDLPTTIDELALASNYGNKVADISGKFFADPDGNLRFNFGKHKGEIAKNYPGFLGWMVYKADFPSDTTALAHRLINEGAEVEDDLF